MPWWRRSELRRADAGFAARELGDAVDGGESDESVDDAAGDVRLAEVLSDKPSDQVELGERDEAPVEPADDHEDDRERVERLHVLPPC